MLTNEMKLLITSLGLISFGSILWWIESIYRRHYNRKTVRLSAPKLVGSLMVITTLLCVGGIAIGIGLYCLISLVTL